MGTTIHAFVEYDDEILYAGHDSSEQPFTRPTDRVIDFTDYVALSHGKDYDFFAAIAGFRNRFDRPPLYRPRGMPPGVNPQVRKHMDRFFEENWVGLGWLTMSEIEAALAHLGLSVEQLSLAVRAVLGCIAVLVEHLGNERVRLVFALDG